jgi:hypothetical protein
MSRGFAVLNRRVALLAFTLCAAAAALVLGPPRADAAAMCGAGQWTAYYTTYYSNANRNVVIGECREFCTGETCTGQISIYTSVFAAGCCPN